MRHSRENWARCRAGSPLSSASGSAMIADGDTRATTSVNSAHVDAKQRLVRALNARSTRSTICDCGTRTATTPFSTRLTRRGLTRVDRGVLASITRHVASLNTGGFCSTTRARRACRHSLRRSQQTQPTATTKSSSDLSRLSCRGGKWSKVHHSACSWFAARGCPQRLSVRVVAQMFDDRARLLEPAAVYPAGHVDGRYGLASLFQLAQALLLFFTTQSLEVGKIF